MLYLLVAGIVTNYLAGKKKYTVSREIIYGLEH